MVTIVLNDPDTEELRRESALVSSALFGRVGSIVKAVDKKLGPTGIEAMRKVMIARALLTLFHEVITRG
jgi:hypothetical protein